MKSDTTVRKLKSIGVKTGVMAKKMSNECEVIPGTPKSGTGKSLLRLSSSPLQMESLMRDKAAGMSRKDIAEKYAISEGYVKEAFAKHYGRNEDGKKVLKGVLTENAIACGMKVAANVDALTPMQAAVATGIMTSRLIELEEHTAEHKEPIDFAEIAKVGKELSELRDFANGS